MSGIGSRTRALIASLSVGVLLLSGCSVLQVRTSDSSSGPLTVAVEDAPGATPTTTPENTLPEGMEEVSLNLGETCPVTVRFAMGSGWTKSSSNDAFIVFSRGDTIADGDVIIVSCSEAFDDTPEEVVTSKKKYAFSKPKSGVLAERVGAFGAGYYWTFQGDLGPSEIFAIGQKPTAMFGADMGYTVNGRLVEINVEMRSLKTNTKAIGEFKTMLPTVSVDGAKVKTPAFK